MLRQSGERMVSEKEGEQIDMNLRLTGFVVGERMLIEIHGYQSLRKEKSDCYISALESLYVCKIVMAKSVLLLIIKLHSSLDL